MLQYNSSIQLLRVILFIYFLFLLLLLFIFDIWCCYFFKVIVISEIASLWCFSIVPKRTFTYCISKKSYKYFSRDLWFQVLILNLLIKTFINFSDVNKQCSRKGMKKGNCASNLRKIIEAIFLPSRYLYLSVFMFNSQCSTSAFLIFIKYSSRSYQVLYA